MQYRTIEQMCSDAHSFTLKSDQCSYRCLYRRQFVLFSHV